jgi:hypothetical protein
MADGNKLKVVNENCKKLENQLQSHHLEWQESMAESKERWVEQGTKIDQLVLQMKTISTQFQQFITSQPARKEIGTSSRGILATPGADKETRMSISIERIAPGHMHHFRGDQMMGQKPHKMGYNIPLPRVDMPTFRGENPHGWLRKCRKYFKINMIPAHQWVEMVSYYLEGKADVWFEGLVWENDSWIDWEEFAQTLCKRFGNREDSVEEFNKLIQDRSVDDYIERFEELRSLMNALNPSLTESYYISSFISGLKEDIKSMLKILKPSNVLMAFEQATWQEESNNALTKRTRSVQRSNTIFNNGGVISSAPSTVFSPNRIEGGKLHSDSLFEQRKRLKQCFKCGDKYTPGHRCSAKGLHMIEGVEEEEDEGIKELEDTMQDECKEMRPIDEFGLSLNALAENDTYNNILSGLRETIKEGTL